MNGSLLAELQRRRFSIRARWETLLRAEPVSSPLAHPDSLVHLIDSTFDEVFDALRNAQPSKRAALTTDGETPHCPCGRNPWLAYFAAAEQALREGLILSQAALAPFDPRERDASLADLNHVLHEISRREIEAFCGVCQFKQAIVVRPSHALAVI